MRIMHHGSCEPRGHHELCPPIPHEFNNPSRQTARKSPGCFMIRCWGSRFGIAATTTRALFPAAIALGRSPPTANGEELNALLRNAVGRSYSTVRHWGHVHVWSPSISLSGNSQFLDIEFPRIRSWAKPLPSCSNVLLESHYSHRAPLPDGPGRT
jgi:hypothetical protein